MLRLELILTVLVALAVPIGYLVITNHIWEDFFITFRHSRNLAGGQGLVYNPGERVHGFTSPLGVLLPALFDWLTGSESYKPALNCFRAVSIAAFAGAVVLVNLALRRSGCSLATRCFATLFLVSEVKSVSYTVNGMETGFMLLFVAAALHTVVVGVDRHWLRCGLVWAGLMWTRPDGCMVIAAFAGAALLFAVRPRREILVGLAKAAAVCTLVYLPWFATAWWYYGSPVPQTILAKIGGYNKIAKPYSFNGFVGDVFDRFFSYYWYKIRLVYEPIYSSATDGWPGWMYFAAKCLSLFAAVYWIVPTRDRVGRAASFAFAVLGVYLVIQNTTFPWYLPPVALCGLVAVATGVPTVATGVLPLFRLLPRSARQLPVVAAVCVCIAIVISNSTVLSLVTRQMRIQQQHIEFGSRQQIGLWLGQQVQPGETIYLECFGYIGYFSGAHIDDFPGLVSPRVSRLRQENRLAFHTLVPELKPDWIVARPDEFQLLQRLEEVRDHYSLVSTFDVTEKLGDLDGMPGANYVRGDAIFYVLHRVKK